MRSSVGLLAAAAVVLGLARHSHALYSSRDSVIEGTASNFDKLVLKDAGVVAVEFYAP